MRDPHVGRLSSTLLAAVLALSGCDGGDVAQEADLTRAARPLSPAARFWVSVAPDDASVEAGQSVEVEVRPLDPEGDLAGAYRGTAAISIGGGPVLATHPFEAEDEGSWVATVTATVAGLHTLDVRDVDDPAVSGADSVEVVPAELSTVGWDGPRGLGVGDAVTLTAVAADAYGNPVGGTRAAALAVDDPSVLRLTEVQGAAVGGSSWSGTVGDGQVQLGLVGEADGCARVTVAFDGGVADGAVEVCVGAGPGGVVLGVPDAVGSIVEAGPHVVEVHFLEMTDPVSRPVHFCLEALGPGLAASPLEAIEVYVTSKSAGRICGWSDAAGHASLLWSPTVPGSASLDLSSESLPPLQITYTITPAPFDHLAASITGFPSLETSTCIDQVEVHAVDAYGNPTEAPPGARALRLAPLPESGPGGTLAIRAVDGEAVDGAPSEILLDLGDDHRAELLVARYGHGRYAVVSPDAQEAPRAVEVRPEPLAAGGDTALDPLDPLVRGQQARAFLTLLDTCNAPLTGYRPRLTWTADGARLEGRPELRPGRYTQALTAEACRLDGARLTVALDGTPVAGTPLTLHCPPPDPDATITVAPEAPVLACPGEAAYEVTVEVRDGEGLFVPGATVEVTSPDFAPLVTGPVDADPAAGVYRIPVGAERCTWDGRGLVSVPLEIRVDGVALTTQPEVAFTCPPLADVAVAPPEGFSVGSVAPLVFTGENACGRPAAGVEVDLAVTGPACEGLAVGPAVDGAEDDALDGQVPLPLRGLAPGGCAWEAAVTTPWDGHGRALSGVVEVSPLDSPPSVSVEAPASVGVDAPFDVVVSIENRSSVPFHDLVAALEGCEGGVLETRAAPGRPGPLAAGRSATLELGVNAPAPAAVTCTVVVTAAVEPGGPPTVRLGEASLSLEVERRAFYGAYGCGSAGGGGAVSAALLLLALALAPGRRRAAGAALAALLLLLLAPAAGVAQTQPAEPTLLPVGIAAPDATAADAEAVTLELRRAVARLGRYRLAEADALEDRGVTTRDRLLRCREDGACLTAVGGDLGLDRLLLASLARQGSDWAVDLALVDLRRGRVVARVSRTARTGRAGLSPLLGAAVAELSAADPGAEAQAAVAVGREAVPIPRPGPTDLPGSGAPSPTAMGGDRPPEGGGASPKPLPPPARPAARAPRWALGVRTDANLGAGSHVTPVPGLLAVWQPGAWGLAASVLWVPGGHDRAWGLRAEGRLAPWRTSRVRPYLLAGATTFLPDLGARAGLGADLPVGSVRVFVEAAYEHFLLRGEPHRPEAWLVAGGLTFAP